MAKHSATSSQSIAVSIPDVNLKSKDQSSQQGTHKSRRQEVQNKQGALTEEDKKSEQGHRMPLADHRQISKATLSERTLLQKRISRWFKVVFLIGKDYAPGDTCRFTWQRQPLIQLSFVWYRVAQMFINLMVVVVSFFHVTFHNQEEFCETQRAIVCIGPSLRLQYEWFFYATSWGLMFNFLQSMWGLVLTLRLYMRERRSGIAQDVEARGRVILMDRMFRQNGKNVSPGGATTKLRDDHNLKSPRTDGSVHSQSKGWWKKIFLKSQNRRNVSESSPTAKTEQHDKVEANSKDGKVSASRFPGKSLIRLLTQKQSSGAVSKVPESSARSAMKEHKILSSTGFYWALHSYSICFTLLIDTIYWTLIWPRLPTSPRVFFIQINEHGVNLPLLIVDYCLVAIPLDLSHAWFTFTIPLLYASITALYYLSGGRNNDRTKHYLYSFLDWTKPARAVAFTVGVASLNTFYLLIILVVDHYKLKWRQRALQRVLQ